MLLDDQNCLPISTQKIGYLFAHGLGATQEQASIFLPAGNSNQWIIKKPAILFDFPDAKGIMEYHHEFVNLGQELDIKRLAFVLDHACQSIPDHKFILTGVSRGAATIINYAALNQPSSIAALILESPFDTLKNVIKHLLRRFCVNWIPYSKEIAYKIAKKNFPLLNIDGIVPLDVINRINKEIPILIIHSQRDKTISINSSRNLYSMLIRAGHAHVYLLELASGDHGKLLQGIEGPLYHSVVHAFYKKYHLPCNPLFAQTGEAMLKYCRPTLDEINKRIRKSRSGVFDDDQSWNEEITPLTDSTLQDDSVLLFPFLFL